MYLLLGRQASYFVATGPRPLLIFALVDDSEQLLFAFRSHVSVIMYRRIC